MFLVVSESLKVSVGLLTSYRESVSILAIVLRTLTFFVTTNNLERRALECASSATDATHPNFIDEDGEFTNYIVNVEKEENILMKIIRICLLYSEKGSN